MTASIYEKINNHNPLKNILVWPRAIVIDKGQKIEFEASFGYITDLIPKNYYDMGCFFRANGDPKQQRFSSDEAMIMAGINIVTAVKRIFIFGYVYNELSINDVFIDPSSGDI